MHIVSTGTQLCDKCGKPMGNARVANSQGAFHAECAGFSPFARIAELEGELRKWLEIYARSPDGLTIAVPVYQIERLTKSTS